MNKSDAIAIVAMAGRFPDAPDVDALWRLLSAGRSALYTPSDEELRAAGVSDERLKDPNYVRARMRFEGVDLFDAGFFGYSAKQAQMLDPQQRLFLECAWEALEAAGYDSEMFDGSIGVFASCGTNLYLLRRALLARCDLGSWRRSDWPAMLIDGDKDHIATRVSYKLGLTGPSVGVQTTCSSSLVAVHLACESLLRGECDLALAGGVSLLAVQRQRGYVYVKDGMDSIDGYCRAFDANATGTAWGSGLGIVALKRHEDAVRDGDHVRALIEGTAINNDGAAKMGYNAPSIRGQQEVVALAQSVARVTPAEIDLIEAHGTGTSLGDSIELAALIELFSAGGAERAEPCALGSIKTNIGHLDVSAGVTGLIKAVLCLEHRAFVPSLHCSTPNPALRASRCPLAVNTELRPWPARPGRPRRAGVSSLGFGGTNAHAIVREAPEVLRQTKRPAEMHLFPLSARGPAALANVGRRLAAHLRARPELDLADVAFTLQVGRRRFRHRQVVVADSRDRLLAALEELHGAGASEIVSDRTERAVVLVCSDEPMTIGAPVHAWYAADAAFRGDIETCARACRAHVDVDLCAFASGNADAAAPAANDPFVARALRFALEYATGRLWRRWGAAPAFALGYGAGRVTARCIAGTLTTDDAMRLLRIEPPAARPAESVAIFRMASSTQQPEPDAHWRDVVRDTDAILLQVGPGRAWRDRLTQPFEREHRVTLVDAFIDRERDRRRHLLEILAGMWLQGVRIDWKRFHADEPPRRVPLPIYPFERASYWLPIPDVARDVMPHATAGGAPRGAESRFFVPSWRVAASGESVSPKLREPGECWLILADNDIGEQLARELERRGHVPIVLRAAAQFREDGDGAFAIAPDSAADYARVLRELRARSLSPRRLVHCWTLLNPAAATSVEAFWQQQTLGYLSLLALAKALAQTSTGPRSLLVVTRGTYSIDEADGACNLANATLPGLCKVMAQELSDLRCTLLDLGGAEDDAASSGERGAAEVARIVGEATDAPSEPVVAYRSGLRLVEMLHERELSADVPTIRELRERGVYAITGGLGKIGLALARRLAQTCRARLVLLTRTPFPERHLWPSVRDEAGRHTVAAKIRALTEIEALGSEVAVYCADVRSETQLERAFAHAESRFGPIAGVFHLAADMTHPSAHRPLTELGRADVEAQMGPKVGGFYALSRVLARRDPDFGVLFSSNASVLGGFGFAAYAAANSVLDHCVRGRLDDGFEWLCTNWDRWTDRAPLDATAGETERHVIETEAGLDALWSIIRRSPSAHVIVASASLPERRERWVARRQRPAAAGRPAQRTSGLAPGRVAPRTELERTIADIWQEVLGCEEIGVEDSFLDLGGDSLIALRILARLRELFQVEVPLKALLGPRPTVASLVVQLVTELQRSQATQPASAPGV